MLEDKKYGKMIEGGQGFAIFEKEDKLTISWPVGIANIPVYKSYTRKIMKNIGKKNAL